MDARDELLGMAVKFLVQRAQVAAAHVYVEAREQRDGSNVWAVTSFGDVLNKQGEWEYEPMPSSRTDAFLRRTRWEDRDKAIAAARAARRRIG
jgi:hypothetical protein